MNKKKLLIIMIILGISFIILGSTFAYWNWMTTEEEKTSVTFTISNNFSCSADGGGDITSADVTLIPTTVSESTSGNYIKREVKVKPSITISGIYIYMDLWLDISDIGTGLTNSDNFMYAFTTSSVSPTEGVISSGNFKGKIAGDKVELLGSKDYNKTATDIYYLWIWLDAAETSPETMNQTFSLSLNGSCADHVTITANTLIGRANPSTLMYANATDEQKGEMWTFSHDATEQTSALTDYRYIGNVPNNYITFNDEVWRIIGIFDVRIKLIRDKVLESMPLDSKNNGVGSSSSDLGSNDWTDSQLMYMLNPTSYKLKEGYMLDENYIKDSSENIIYQLGCKPTGITSGATSYNCTENTWSLNETALSQISEATYYLGGFSINEANTQTYYTIERGKKASSGRETSWIGLVGLMSPSDYGYTFANVVSDGCYTKPYSCGGYTPSSSWLFSKSDEWLISPCSSYSYIGAYLTSNGRIGTVDEHYNKVYFKQYFRPVVYLRDNIKLTGIGTSSEPYEIIS